MSKTESRAQVLSLPKLTVPTFPITARLPASTIASAVALHIANGVDNRADLARAAALSRTTVATGIDFLLERGLLGQSEGGSPTGRGRPSDRLRFSTRVGMVAVIDLGLATSSISLFGADQTAVASRFVHLDFASGPDLAFPALMEHVELLLADAGEAHGRVNLCVVAVPGPIDGRRGAVNRPPLLPGWESFDLSTALSEAMGCDVIVEKDVNLRVLGEARTLSNEELPLVLVKVAAAIEAGIVLSDGSMYRGADGFAGDVGHIATSSAEGNACACGNIGCLATIASTDALAARLSALKGSEVDLLEFERLVRDADPDALQLFREGINALGDVLAGLVNFVNPARIVISGALTEWNPDILSGVRRTVYDRSLPITTTRLSVVTPLLGHWSGTSGGLTLGIERLLNEEHLLERPIVTGGDAAD